MISIITRRRKVFSFGISAKVRSLGFQRENIYNFRFLVASDAYAVKALLCLFYSVNFDDASKWILSFVMQTAKHTKCICKHCCVVIYFSENNCPNYRNERYNSVKYFQPIDLFYFVSFWTILYTLTLSLTLFLSFHFSLSPSLLRFAFISAKIIMVASSHSNSRSLSRSLSLSFAPFSKCEIF